MKITKNQLKKLIREMHPRAAADDAYVADLERQEDELATQIRHASKDIHGRKDVYDLSDKSVKELEDILYDLGNSPEQRDIDNAYRDEEEDAMGRDQDLSPEEMAPQRRGMKRRPRGSKSQRRMESTMKITKRQLNKIISEEKLAIKEMDNFNSEVREAYCEHILLNYPNILLAEGYISKEAYARACKMKVLTESNRVNKKIEEGFFDDVKAMAKKVGGKALDKGKELGKKGLAKAKEIGDTEIDVKGTSKEMKRVGKEAGELAAGAGEAMLNFIGPMAQKLGDKASKFAQKKLKQIDKQGPKALAAISKHIEGGVNAALSKAKSTTGSGIKGLADLIRKAKDGLTYEQLATKEPAAFMATYKALEKKVLGMKLKGVTTPQTAEQVMGIFRSPDGQKALAAAAKKTGMAAAELDTIMGMYVFQSRYVPMATKAAAMKESFNLERRIIERVKRKIRK